MRASIRDRANDNASGCGLILELAEKLSKGISEGRIPKPFFNIRFLMGFECAGLLSYYHQHHDRMPLLLEAINTDMVGFIPEDRAVLSIWHNPLSNWSFADTLLPEIVSAYRFFFGENFDLNERGYDIGDNILADPLLGIPTVSMLMHPSLSYHTSMDDMNKTNEPGFMSNLKDEAFTNIFLQVKSAYFIDGPWRFVAAKEAGVNAFDNTASVIDSKNSYIPGEYSPYFF
jgi:aminopeptidase-like protein